MLVKVETCNFFVQLKEEKKSFNAIKSSLASSAMALHAAYIVIRTITFQFYVYPITNASLLADFRPKEIVHSILLMMSVKSRFRRFMLSLIKWNEWNLLNDFPEKFPFPKVAFRGRRKNKTQCWVHRNTVNARWSSHKNPKGSNKLSHNIHWKPAERYFACPLLIIIWVKCFIHVLCWWLFNKKKHTHERWT